MVLQKFAVVKYLDQYEGYEVINSHWLAKDDGYLVCYLPDWKRMSSIAYKDMKLTKDEIGEILRIGFGGVAPA